MDEIFLKKASFIVFLVGLICLVLLFIFQKPFFVALDEKIPQDDSFTLNATIVDLYQTKTGTFVVFSYVIEESGFFQGNTSFLESKSSAIIEGSKSNDYLSIDSIILT